METRNTYYLIGNSVSEILGAKLPSYKQAFGYFLHKHFEEGKTAKESLRLLVQSIVQFWDKASLPTRQPYHCLKKLDDFWSDWKGLRKHSGRETDSHKKKMDDLFDIAHVDVEKKVRYREDFEFLQQQRQKGRPGSIGSLDSNHTKRADAHALRLAEEEARRKRSEAEVALMKNTAVLESSSSSTEDSLDEANAEYKGACCGSAQSKKWSGVKNVMTHGLSAALDRTTQVSSRSAAYLLSSFGLDPTEFNINPSSIHRQREKFRARTTEEIKAGLQGDHPLTVH